MQLKLFGNNWPEHIDYTKQTIEVPGTKEPGEMNTLTCNLSPLYIVSWPLLIFVRANCLATTLSDICMHAATQATNVA